MDDWLNNTFNYARRVGIKFDHISVRKGELLYLHSTPMYLFPLVFYMIINRVLFCLIFKTKNEIRRDFPSAWTAE